jgi:hypothetical protein
MEFIEYFRSLPSVIVYTNNKEYRDHIRKALRFDPKEKYTYEGKLVNMEDMDEESRDEILFDSKAVSKSLDAIFEATKHESFFRELYEHAAARMFSEDLEIGLAVVCSYDVFNLYYSCVWYYLQGGVSSLFAIQETKKLKAYFEMG